MTRLLISMTISMVVGLWITWALDGLSPWLRLIVLVLVGGVIGFVVTGWQPPPKIKTEDDWRNP